MSTSHHTFTPRASRHPRDLPGPGFPDLATRFPTQGIPRFVPPRRFGRGGSWSHACRTDRRGRASRGVGSHDRRRRRGCAVGSGPAHGGGEREDWYGQLRVSAGRGRRAHVLRAAGGSASRRRSPGGRRHVRDGRSLRVRVPPWRPAPPNLLSSATSAIPPRSRSWRRSCGRPAEKRWSGRSAPTTIRATRTSWFRPEAWPSCSDGGPGCPASSPPTAADVPALRPAIVRVIELGEQRRERQARARALRFERPRIVGRMETFFRDEISAFTASPPPGTSSPSPPRPPGCSTSTRIRAGLEPSSSRTHDRE